MINLIQSLDNRIKVQEAATGTMYITFNGKKVRVGDHEPNDGAGRGTADLELYTFDACNTRINSNVDIAFQVADFFNLPYSSELEAAADLELKAKIESVERQVKAQKEMEAVKERVMNHAEAIKAAIAGREDEVNAIFQAADERVASISSKQNARKKRINLFKAQFNEAFGFEATPSEVTNALK